MTPPGPALATVGLTKRYGERIAVGGLTLAVRPGELFALLGPNGAGKSTTIAMLATLVAPTAGSATVNGFDVRTRPHDVRRSIGMVFQQSTLDPLLTAREHLRFQAAMYGLAAPTASARADLLLGLMGLAERADEPVARLSGGLRRRLEIARALLHQPVVLFLDEPTTGLDPAARARTWEHINEVRADTGTTVVLTTHYLDEADGCDRVAILDRGQVAALDTPEALKRGVGVDTVVLATADDERARADIATRLGLQTVPVAGGFAVTVPDGHRWLPRLLAAVDDEVRSASMRGPSLEDVFLRLTGYGLRDAGGRAA